MAKALAERYPEVGQASPIELHRQQEQWKEASEREFAAYRQKRGEAYVPEPGWPVRERPAEGAEDPETGLADLPSAPGGLF